MNPAPRMNILITGSTGFIGSHLVSAYTKKYNLLTPGHSQLDLLSEKSVRSYFLTHSVDIVIHCAVIGGNGPRLHVKDMFYDNVRMFFNIARCKKYYRRLIHIGSGAVYDKRFPIVKIREEDLGKSIPSDEYGLYKYLCAAYINSTDNMVDLRVFGLFGEREEYRQRFISNALCRVILGLPITIRQNVYFDYLDVKDFADIVEYFIHHEPKYKAYNIGSGRKRDLVSISKTIIKLFGAKKRAVVFGKQHLGHEYSCDTKRLRAEVPAFKPRPFYESLERLYSWYQRNKHTIKGKELI